MTGKITVESITPKEVPKSLFPESDAKIEVTKPEPITEPENEIEGEIDATETESS